MKLILITIGFLLLGVFFIGFGNNKIFNEAPSNEVDVTQNRNLEVLAINGLGFKYDPAIFKRLDRDQNVPGYIPACDPEFFECLLYNNDFEGTNFDIAGMRFNDREELRSDELCLTTPPVGYASNFAPVNTFTVNGVQVSEFTIGDAGAGHYAEGNLYRYFDPNSNSCSEVETRIAATQFQNYPTGSINEFSKGDRKLINKSFNQVLNSIIVN